MRKKQIVPIIVFACDLSHFGARLGRETEERCDKVTNRAWGIFRLDLSPVIVLTAGKANPKKFPLQREEISYMMSDFFHNTWQDIHSSKYPQIITVGSGNDLSGVNNNVWGTKAEILTFIETIEEDEYIGLDRVHHIIFGTSWYHVPRVWLLWRFHCPRELRSVPVEFCVARGKFSNSIVELVKLPIVAFLLALSILKGKKK